MDATPPPSHGPRALHRSEHAHDHDQHSASYLSTRPPGIILVARRGSSELQGETVTANEKCVARGGEMWCAKRTGIKKKNVVWKMRIGTCCLPSHRILLLNQEHSWTLRTQTFIVTVNPCLQLPSTLILLPLPCLESRPYLPT
jgi:hypothetical protein